MRTMFLFLFFIHKLNEIVLHIIFKVIFFETSRRNVGFCPLFHFSKVLLPFFFPILTLICKRTTHFARILLTATTQYGSYSSPAASSIVVPFNDEFRTIDCAKCANSSARPKRRGHMMHSLVIHSTVSTGR